MKNKIIKIGGMHCVRCSKAVERALSSVDGVVEASVNFSTEKAYVKYDETKVTAKTLNKAVKGAGYSVVEDEEEFRRKELLKAKIEIFVSFFFAIPFILMMFTMFFLPKTQLNAFLHNGILQFAFATPVQLLIGSKFYIGAFKSIKNKSVGMDLLVALGTTIAYVYSCINLFTGKHMYYFESSVFIIAFVNLGRFLELKAKMKTSDSITMLLNLAPKTVNVLNENKEEVKLPLDQLKKGDVFVVRAGESIATDGTVLEGTCAVNESMLTGESLPKTATAGCKVYGGTIVDTGMMTVQAEKVGNDTKLAEIAKLVENAQNGKASAQRLADKVSAIFVPAVISIAVIVFIINLLATSLLGQSLSRAVAVLVIACPCALGLATPTALTVGVGRASKSGVLIKSADTLEKLSTVKTVVFDKTGTLTYGEPKVVEFKEIEKTEKIGSIIRSIESRSSHPLARSVCAYFKDSEIAEVNDYSEIIGYGVKADVDGKTVYIGSSKWINSLGIIVPTEVKEYQKAGQTALTVRIDDKIVAVIVLEDQIKDDAKEAVKSLKSSGLRTVMATGDNKYTAMAISEKTDIDEVYADVEPSYKVEVIKNHQTDGGVAFVGDGINDSPALASADVGIAIGGGMDIAIESGDVVLLNEKLSSVAFAIKLSRATMRKIKQNLFWAFFYNVITIPLAACGLLSPVIAGLCMAMSSLCVVTNSLLIYRVKA